MQCSMTQHKIMKALLIHQNTFNNLGYMGINSQDYKFFDKMDQKNNKRYAEKHPPDKPKKPKYVEKKQATRGQDRPKHNNQSPFQQSTNFKEKAHQHYPKNDRRQSDVKPPRFVEKDSNQSNEVACVICSEGIYRREPTWTCQQCFNYLHLKCIKQWIYNVNKNSMSSQQKGKYIYNWSCPQCKFQYNEAMPEYYCFCGKFKNPEPARDLEPHSCGSICGRKRGPYCPHLCPIPCHSGKCPPCDQQGTLISCNCGKTQRVVKCSQQRQIFQCGKKCQKILNCHKHKCQRNCHKGQCYPCSKKHMSKCFCQKNQDVIDCMKVSYTCGEICEKKLDCGYHFCEDKCHEGQCLPCRRTPQIQKTCPCGRNSIMLLTGDDHFRKSCADPIPLCGMPCKKTLQCGHQCPRSCHEGKCAQCKVLVQQNCECGLTSRKVECYVAHSNKEEHKFKCDNICKRKKTCGQHACNTVCCKYRNSILLQDHKCQLTCQKLLNCKKHNCGQPCHVGQCKKCPVIYSQPQPCPCGVTFLKPPILCGTFVPQCQNVCNKPLGCKHTCQMKCHYGICHCYELVLVMCRCGRENIQTTCGKETLCLNHCKKTLTCGHQCLLQCHAGTCEQAHQDQPCRKTCEKKRQTCTHLCSQPCHMGRRCEEFPCEAQILIKCQCGNRTTTIICGNSDKKQKKTIVCNKRCQNVKRFDALYKDKQIYYPTGMFQFGFKNFNYLQKIEARLQRFISSSQEAFMEIQFKFLNDNNARLQLMNLFQNHYHLNTHFYRYRNHASFTVMQTDDTMIPKPVLTQYIKQVSKGYIKRNNLPFEYTVKFQCSQKEKVQVVLRCLANFRHRYYVEKKDKYYVHFWDKSDGLQGLQILKDQNPSYEFFGQENTILIEAEDLIGEGEILQEEVAENENQEKSSHGKHKNIKQESAPSNTQSKPSQDLPKHLSEKREIPSMPGIISVAEPSKRQLESKTEKKGPKLVFRNQPFLQKAEYPPAKEFVQEIYLIDEDELYGENVNWQGLAKTFCDKNIGPEASEWRMRSLVMINDIQSIGQTLLAKQFENLINMYEKDKTRAKRILQIQKLETKKVKQEMDNNGIYLSKFEPEILAYAKLYNHVSNVQIDGIEQLLNDSQELRQTHEITRVLEVVQYVEKADIEAFYTQFKNSDFLMATLMKELIPQLRQNVLKNIQQKKTQYPVNNFDKYLFFDSLETTNRYFEVVGGISLDRKHSKSQGQQVIFLKQDIPLPEDKHKDKEEMKELALKVIEESKTFIKILVKEKREKKYFLTQPEQLVQEKYMTRSFFAFGDFKESINPNYILNLSRKLKNE